MDTTGFRKMLVARGMPADRLENALALAQRFENYAGQSGGYSKQVAWDFSGLLISEGQNSVENFVTLARWGLFTGETVVYVAFLEALDGSEAQENLYRKVGEQFGEALRDEVFAGVGLAPFGLPASQKPAVIQPVIERLERVLGQQACRDLLADSLRDLPDSLYERDRQRFFELDGDIDAFLIDRKQRFVSQLQSCLEEGRLFFAQEVTPQVIEYVRSQPEMGGGVRDGEIVYETKIPYLTTEYLAAMDETSKRYAYCHCPWVREALRNQVAVPAVFCNCSAGFHKKPWEAVLGQSIRVDVLESVAQGDPRCRFALHLPVAGAEA